MDKFCYTWQETLVEIVGLSPAPVIRITLDSEQAAALSPLLDARVRQTGVEGVLALLERAYNPMAGCVTLQLKLLAVDKKTARKIVELAKTSHQA